LNSLPDTERWPGFPRRIVVGTAVGHVIVILLVILLCIVPPRPMNFGGQGDGFLGTGSGDSGAGSGSGDSGTDDPPTEVTEASTAEESGRNLREPLPPTANTIQPLDPPKKKKPARTASRKSGWSDSSGAKTFSGMKVKGDLALVCDVSVSMSSDFPKLVKELRRKFPRDTPLILVKGCAFDEYQPGGPWPVQAQLVPYVEARYQQDRHAYTARNTTDAIVFAVKELERDTVIFNNDLQDGGTLRAIASLETVWKERPFMLSGRSLNCDCPPELRAFIRKTGGDFKVDTIGRQAAPARLWQP
jgi:hypothetical protein